MPKRRPQGDGMVRKRKDGRWEARIVIGHKNNGEPMYKSYFGKTQKEALKRLHEGIDLYQDVDLTEDCKMTVSEWLHKWIDEYMIFTIRESTLQSYSTIIKWQVEPFIGNKQISTLTTADVQKLYNRVKKEGRAYEHPRYGKQLSDSFVRSVHMMLHEAFDMAVKERVIAKNPTEGTTIPKAVRTEKQVLDDDQLETFLDALSMYPEWYDFFYTEVMTGLRKGEICGLKWTDIDFENNKMHIRRAVTKVTGVGLTVGETKTTTGKRTIVLPPSVIEILKKRKSEQLSEWIFYNLKNPIEPMNTDVAYRKLKMILKNAGLPLIRFHDLRHTFATHAMKSGVDPKTLSGILGHTNASFTLDTYTHVTTDMQKNASAIVNNMIKKIKLGD